MPYHNDTKFLDRQVLANQVFAKTAGLSDKTAKFRKCLAIFVSLPDSMSDEKLIQKNAQTVFSGDLVCNQCSHSNFKLGVFIPPMYKICGYEVKFTGMTFYLKKVIGRNGHGPK